MFEIRSLLCVQIAAGLVLVQRRQKIVLQRNPSSPEFDRPARPLPWMTASNLSYFSRYALSIYGWPLFVFMNPCTGPFELLKRRSCCGCHRDIDIPVVGRDSQCYLAGLEALLDLPRVRLIHCSFVNNVFTCPFFIAIDDDAKAVVISVRGTMSFMDAITGKLWVDLIFLLFSLYCFKLLGLAILCFALLSRVLLLSHLCMLRL